MCGRITILLTSEPNVVWDPNDKWDDKSVAAVQGLDCSKSILEVISSGGVKENAIEFEPSISPSFRADPTRFSKIVVIAN
jgi:hypothetical protein